MFPRRFQGYLNPSMFLKEISCPDDMDFSLRMTEITYEIGKNSVTSPVSLLVAMLMALVGSKGESRKEILKVLFQQDEMNDDQFKSYSNDLIEKFAKFFQDNEDVLSSANMTYYDQKLPIKQNYMDFLIQKFGVVAKQLNFKDEEKTLEIINEDVKKATKDMIPKILEKILPLEKFILVNAIYFKGLWEKPFPKESVHDADFFKSDGQTIKVKMMKKTDWNLPYFYHADMKVKAIRLPYTSGSISMLLLLPDEDNSVGNVLKQLNKEQMNAILFSLFYKEVDVVMMPKFKIESSHPMDLHLQKLGVIAPFEDRNEFPDISDKSLFISRIIQKAIIEVDEEGTKAAAVTAVTLRLQCNITKFQRIEFIANRPFIFMLISKDTNHILFSGVVENPTQ